jgi:hypothetical protein
MALVKGMDVNDKNEKARWNIHRAFLSVINGIIKFSASDYAIIL